MSLSNEWELRECKTYPGRIYYYNKNTNESTWIRPIPPSNYTGEWPPFMFLSHILIKYSTSNNNNIKRTRKEAEEKIKKIYLKIKEKKETFNFCAKTYSECNTNSKVGELGWVSKENISPEFFEISWKLQIGEFSTPFETIDGFHIVLRSG